MSPLIKGISFQVPQCSRGPISFASKNNAYFFFLPLTPNSNEQTPLNRSLANTTEAAANKVALQSMFESPGTGTATALVCLNSSSLICWIASLVPASAMTDKRSAEGHAGAADDQWEIVDDDGFIYKRRKTNTSFSYSNQQRQQKQQQNQQLLRNENDLQYLRQRRVLQKQALQELRAKYSKELSDWQSLSQLLNSSPACPSSHPISSPPSFSSQKESLGAQKKGIKELLQQVEAQEALIRSVSSICSCAELICQAHEEELKKPILDLSVWDSPTKFMHRLCPSSEPEDD